MSSKVRVVPRDETLAKFEKQEAQLRADNPGRTFVREVTADGWPQLWLREGDTEWCVVTTGISGGLLLINSKGEIDAPITRPAGTSQSPQVGSSDGGTK